MKQLKHKLIQQGHRQMFADYPDMLDIPTLMRMLHIGQHAAYNLVRSGKIESVRIGRGYRIPKVAVQKFLYENT